MKRLALVVAVGLALAACTTATKPVDTVPPNGTAPVTSRGTATVGPRTTFELVHAENGLGLMISDPPSTVNLTVPGTYRLAWSAPGCQFLEVGIGETNGYMSPGANDSASLPNGETILTNVPAGTAYLVMPSTNVPECQPAVRLEKVAP